MSEDRTHKLSALKTEIVKVQDTLMEICDRLKVIEEGQMTRRAQAANLPSQTLNHVLPAKSDDDVNKFLDDAEMSNAIFAKERKYLYLKVIIS